MMNHSNVAGALVGKNSESESEQTPTSPFDVGMLSFNSLKHPSESDGRYQKRWNSGKVGLGLVYSLAAADNGESNGTGKVVHSCCLKTAPAPVIEEPKPADGDDGETDATGKVVHSYCLKTAPASVIEEPKPADGHDGETNGTGKVVHSYCLKVSPASVTEEPKPANVGVGESNVIFGIGEAVYVPEMRPHSFGAGLVGSFLSSEIEVSEDYTRVTIRGPNPEATHIFGDHVLRQENSLVYSLAAGDYDYDVGDDDDDTGESNGTGKDVHSYCLKVAPPAAVIEEPKPANVGVIESSVIFEIGEAVYVPVMHPHSCGTGLVGSFFSSEIEESEEYTRVTVHGPNPKVTHIFRDHVLRKENSLIYSLAAGDYDYNEDDDDDDTGESNGTGKDFHSHCLKVAPPAAVIEEPKPVNVGVRESNVIFEIGEAVYVPEMRLHNHGPGFVGSLLSSEIEESEEYTRVTVHGPNPKVTHIFCDHVLGQENSLFTYFLKNCYGCQKELDGEDIYMYRGEKAFCSSICRAKEIEMDEEMEKDNDNDRSSKTSDMSNNSEE